MLCTCHRKPDKMVPWHRELPSSVFIVLEYCSQFWKNPGIQESHPSNMSVIFFPLNSGGKYWVYKMKILEDFVLSSKLHSHAGRSTCIIVFFMNTCQRNYFLLLSASLPSEAVYYLHDLMMVVWIVLGTLGRHSYFIATSFSIWNRSKIHFTIMNLFWYIWG